MDVEKNSGRPLSPEERAFDIDHITELIFSHLDNETLFKCRLVSHLWSFFSSKQLQQQQRNLHLSFNIEKPKLIKSPLSIFSRCQKHSSPEVKKRRSLSKLSKLLKNSVHFPILSFEFKITDMRIMSLTPKHFLDRHGSLIRKISIDGPLHFEDLKALLFTQAPNLQELELTSYHFGSKNNVHTCNSIEENHKLKTILTQIKENNETISLSLKLRVFKPGPVLAPKYIWEILQVSPNIQQLYFPSIPTPTNVAALLHGPVNYVHLVKTLHVHLSFSNYYSSVYTSLIDHHPGNWAIQEIDTRDETSLRDSATLGKYKRAGVVLQKIMELNSDTCTKLQWIQFGFLSQQQLVIPQMGKVRRIQFHYNFRNYSETSSTLFFPKGTSLPDAFPNLTHVSVHYYEYIFEGCYKNIPVPRDISYLFDNVEPVLSVTQVSLNSPLYAVPRLLKELTEMFPNARFKTHE